VGRRAKSFRNNWGAKGKAEKKKIFNISKKKRGSLEIGKAKAKKTVSTKAYAEEEEDWQSSLGAFL